MTFKSSNKYYSLLFFLILLWACNDNDNSLQTYFTWTPERTPLISAHRGGPYPGYPENCIETFEHILTFTEAIIECDIMMTKDSVLILMHDNTLDRTTTGKGKVSDLTYSSIKKLYLKDNWGLVTDIKIPTLKSVLKWAKGKCILSLDVKRGVPYKEIIELVEDYQAENYSIFITYNVKAAKEVFRLNPELMISVGIYTKEDLFRYDSAGIPLSNLIAFTGVSQKDTSLYNLLHRNGIYCILGTLGNLDRMAQVRGDHIYLDFIEKGVDILATDRPIEAAETLRPYKGQ